MKSGLGAYRSPFLIEKSNARRKFSIEDRGYVERSQKSLKVNRKVPQKTDRFWMISKCALHEQIEKKNKLLPTVCGIILSPQKMSEASMEILLLRKFRKM